MSVHHLTRFVRSNTTTFPIIKKSCHIYKVHRWYTCEKSRLLGSILLQVAQQEGQAWGHFWGEALQRQQHDRVTCGSRYIEAQAAWAHMACHVLHCLYLKRPIWELEDTGDIGPVQIRVCTFQQLLWHLHIAALNLEEVWVYSRQHGHHPCASTSHFTRAATDRQHTFAGHSRHCILTCSRPSCCCCCCCWITPTSRRDMTCSATRAQSVHGLLVTRWQKPLKQYKRTKTA